MSKKIKILVSFLCCGLFSLGQIGMGEWRVHSESKNAKDIVSLGNSVFVAFSSILMEYDDYHKEASTWNITNGLSDIQLLKLGVHESSGSVFVGYQNGNIDQIKDGKVINIPGIKLASIMGSKIIHSIKSHESYAYFATGFGIVKVDPNKHEIKDTYYPGGASEDILEVTFKGDSIFALTPTKLYKGSLNNPALADESQWTVDTRLPILSGNPLRYQDAEWWNDSLYYQQNHSSWGSDTVFIARPGGRQPIFDLGTFGELISLQVVQNKLVMNGDGIVLFFKYNSGFVHDFGLNEYTSGIGATSNATIQFNDSYWFADTKSGLVRRYFDENVEFITFPGPEKDLFYSMDWRDGALAIVPGAVVGNGSQYYQPGIMFFEKEAWKTIGRNDTPLWAAGNTWDNIAVSINPTNKNEIAIGAVCKTPISIFNRETGHVVDTFGVSNSPLQKFASGSIFATSLSYDDEGNLWIVNGFAGELLKLRTKDGAWYSFNLGTATANKPTRKMLCDYNGNVWISVYNTGLLGYNPGSSISSSSDDKTILLNSGDFSGALPSNIITAIAMDFDNELWIGTDNGFAILYNSENAFDASPGSYNVQRPKIDINGETDYILANVYINDIEIDGGNRKWIATANSGMILLSDDGLSIIEHFTMENSPLVSNNILDLEIDHKTGEIFIITDKGLMSYRGDATYEDPEYSDVKIFPNPARPDHDGLITIQGIRFNSDVKITDVAGNVVYRTTSNGGTATWDGKTVNGEKVVSGVYLIWTASNISKGRYVGKVVVVN
jgi:hypothetical protein